MTAYTFQHLRATSASNRELLAQVWAGEHYAGSLWGAFTGLFGMAANELYVVSASEEPHVPKAAPMLHVAELWQPTARPQTPAPCSADGLYVFRRFHVRAADVDEFVDLSAHAWETFETDADYAAEPKGLFRPGADDEGVVRMMLVTWYDGFTSWERSRRPAPAAAENFAARRELTLTTYAVAARLAIR